MMETVTQPRQSQFVQPAIIHTRGGVGQTKKLSA
jgi:hypothetical protein